MTTALPPELAPWAPHLRGLVHELAAEIATLARRLDAAIGPLRPRIIEAGGEPDGYRGLSRRGPYDRLLLSEWALLDAVPDEFVRRAAEHEHAFYALEHRSPRVGVRCEAVFDAGPESLGAPRIAHVALLVVLARRAEAAGAEFVWSVAQSQAGQRTGVDAPGIRVLLDARSASRFVAPTSETPDTDRPIADERWYIGGPACRGHAGIIAAIVEDVIDPACDEVVVSVERPGRTPVSITLPLPPIATRRRLITDPLTPKIHSGASKRGVVGRDSDPENPWRTFPPGISDPVSVRFLPGTRQMYCAFRRGPVLVWSFAKVETIGLPKARLELAYLQEPSFALGYRGQRMLEVIHYQKGQVAAYGKGIALRADAPTLPKHGPGEAVAVGNDVYFTDGGGTLWRIRDPGGGAPHQLTRVEEGCTGLLAVGGHLVALLERPAGSFGALFEPREWTLRDLNANVPDQDLGTADRHWLLPNEVSGPYWQRIARAANGRVQSARVFQHHVSWDYDVEKPPGELIGVATMWHKDVGFGLCAVTWDASKGCFRRSLDGATFTVPRTPVGAQLSPSGTFVAFTTAEGTVEVWRYDGGRPMLLANAGES